MNICRMARYFPSYISHGWIVSAYYLSKAQVDLGHKIILLSGEKGIFPEYEKLENFEVYRVFSTMPRPFHLKTIAYNFSAIKKLKELDKKYNFDLIHGHDKDPFIYGFLHKFKKDKHYVLHSHSLTAIWVKKGIAHLKTKGISGYLNRITDIEIRKIYEEIAHKTADLIFAVSEAHKKDICNLYKIDESKVIVSYNGVDTDLFKPLKKEKSDKINFLAVGADFRKGIHILAEAFEILRKKYGKKIILTIIGGDKDTKNIFYNIPGVKIYNSIPFVNMPEIYNNCDVYVSPSLYETFGKTITEAMACEKPVISTEVCGIPEVVDNNKTGILIKENDSVKLAKAMETLFLDEKMRKKMGKEGRKKVIKYFTWDKVARRVDEGYKLLFY